MPGKLIQFGERAGVKQELDTLPRCLLAFRVLLLDCRRRSRVDRLLHAKVQVSQLSGGAVNIRRRNRTIHD